MSDYKPSPFYRTPFAAGLAVIILIIIAALAWQKIEPSEMTDRSATITTPPAKPPARP